MKTDIRNNIFMGIVTLADVVDATANFVTNKPVNSIGILLFGVVLVYWLSYFQEKYHEKYDE